MMGSGQRILPVFALASGAAVTAGAATLALSGSPLGGWIRNPAAWLLGMALAVLIDRSRPGRTAAIATVALAVCGLAATFLANPVDGVHRWVDVGPLHINMAALVLPPALVALAILGRPMAMLAAGGATGLILAAQPDASQAIAFMAGTLVLIVSARSSAGFKLLAAAVFAAIAVLTWLRPDPLQPVPEVEGVLALAFGLSAPLGALAAMALCAACLAPLLADRSELRKHRGAHALAVYFLVCAAAPLFGHFPVPLVGLGMSFPMGWWLGVGLLRAARSREH